MGNKGVYTIFCYFVRAEILYLNCKATSHKSTSNTDQKVLIIDWTRGFLSLSLREMAARARGRGYHVFVL